MITDSKNKNWMPNEDRSMWTSSDNQQIVVNNSCTDEQVLCFINELIKQSEEVPKTESERIKELEEQVKALLARLS